MTDHVNLLDVLTADRLLPDGCDTWAIRTVRPDLRSSRGYRWPWPGTWATAPGPIRAEHTGECPSAVGDGICVASTWAGMASGGVPASTLLLCAYASADVLGRAAGKLRLSRVYVVDVVDGERLVRQHGAGAYLTGAYLTGADLTGAYLTGADLTGAYLTDADLARADLTGARYDQWTRWPAGLDPTTRHAVQNGATS